MSMAKAASLQTVKTIWTRAARLALEQLIMMMTAERDKYYIVLHLF